MNTVVYMRTSTEEQKEAGTVATQREVAERYCRSNAISVSDWYIDEGVSGTVPVERRPSGARLLRDAATGKFDEVLVYRIDRLARSTLELHRCVEALSQNNVLIRSISEPFELGSIAGKLMMTMLGGMAQFEKDTFKQRSRDGKLRNVREGKWSGGLPPLGYMVVDKKLVIEETEAELIRKIFKLYLEDRLGTKRIADLLTARQVPLAAQTKGKRQAMSGVWSASMVARILNNPVYKGKLTYGKTKTVTKNGATTRQTNQAEDEHIATDVPAIVDDTSWEQAQALLRHNSLMSPRNGKRPYLLRGLMKCATCGGTYVGCGPGGSPRSAKIYYKCSSRANSKYCGGPYLRQDIVEEAVWADIVEFVRNPGAVLSQLAAKLEAQAEQQVPIHAECVELERQLVEKQTERKRVIGFMRRAIISEQEGADELFQIRADIAVLEERRKALLDRQQTVQAAKTRLIGADALLRELRDALESVDFTTRRRVIEALVDRISIGSTLDDTGKKRPRVQITYCFERPAYGPEGYSDWFTSAGAENKYGHPSSETLQTLQDAGVTVYRTDLNGTIEVIADKERLWVRSER